MPDALAQERRAQIFLALKAAVRCSAFSSCDRRIAVVEDDFAARSARSELVGVGHSPAHAHGALGESTYGSCDCIEPCERKDIFL